jgi:hypothetical protein
MGKQLLAETIYAALYVLPRGTLHSARLTTLRQARKARRPRSRGVDRRGQIPNMTPIAWRPAEVMTRMVPGHSEEDFNARARYGWRARRHFASSEMVIYLACPYSRSTVLAHVRDTRFLTRRIPPRQ